MERIQMMIYQGHKIWYVDYSNLKGKEMLTLLREAHNRILKDNTSHMQLINITNARINTTFLKEAQRLANTTNHLLLKGAIVGVTVLTRTLLRAYNKMLGDSGLQPFETIEEAKAWLVK